MITAPEIAVDYSLTFPEFNAGHKLALRQVPLFYLVRILAIYVTLGLALLIFVLTVFSYFDGQRQAVPNLLILFVLLCLPSILMRLTRLFSFNRLKFNKSEDPRMTFMASPHEFCRRIHNMGDLTWLWSATQGFSKNQSVVVLHARKGSVIIIPRHALTGTQVARLEEMSQRKGQT